MKLEEKDQAPYQGLPVIGIMIEFLGNDYWMAVVDNSLSTIIDTTKANRLCDALWSACKQKLNNSKGR